MTGVIVTGTLVLLCVISFVMKRCQRDWRMPDLTVTRAWLADNNTYPKNGY